MLPREHGAYGQLLFPLATVLAMGRPGAAALAITAAAVCVFLAHEPLLVLLGARGPRAARETRATAWRWVATLSALAVSLGVFGLVRATEPARAALLLPAALAAAVGVGIRAGRERTIAGEMCSALALASIALPVGVAAGVPNVAATTCVAAYACSFVCATACVHAVIAYSRRPPATGTRVAAGAAIACGMGALGWLASSGLLSAIAPWAATPVCAVGGYLTLVPPKATRLRTIGWALVASSVATGAILLAAPR